MWRVILADDEQYVLTGLQTLIRWEDYNCEVVATAANGQELLRQVDALGADIAVLDIRMPGLTGLDAARLLRRGHPDMVLLFLTGYEDFEYAKAAINLGADAYIGKTEVLEELPLALAKADEQLRQRRAGEELPVQVTLLRTLCDGTYAMRKKEEALARAYRTLATEFTACRLLAVWIDGEAAAQDYDNLCLLFESSFRRFSPQPFLMRAELLCLLLHDVEPQVVADECAALLPVADSFCGLRPVIALSGELAEPDALHGAFAEVSARLAERPRDGEARILFAHEEAPGHAESTPPEALEALLNDPSAQARWLEDYAGSIRRLDLTAARSKSLQVLSDLSTLCSHYDKAPPSAHEHRTAILTAQTLSLLCEILRQAMEETAALLKRENTRIYSLIRETDAYIAAHTCEKLSLKAIAGAVHANPSHLSRFYKEKTGENLFEVINRQKVERAAELLRTTDLRAYEVADAVGFTDTSNFSKFFKKHTGLSPREYAQAKGGEPQ